MRKDYPGNFPDAHIDQLAQSQSQDRSFKPYSVPGSAALHELEDPFAQVRIHSSFGALEHFRQFV